MGTESNLNSYKGDKYDDEDKGSAPGSLSDFASGGKATAEQREKERVPGSLKDFIEDSKPPKQNANDLIRTPDPKQSSGPTKQVKSGGGPMNGAEENGNQGYSEQEGGETLGEQEHEMALARQLDQQKKIDADFKAGQEASAKPEKAKAPEKEDTKETAEEEEEGDEPDQPYTPPPGTPPEDKAPDQSEDKSQEEKEAAWQRKGAIESANLMRKAAMEKDAQKQKEAADQIPDPTKVGPQETLKRAFTGKCFSCTGCIGFIYRISLDFLAASGIYALLDMLWQDDNTDKCFSCNCCCSVLSVILLLAAPILIGIGLALLAAKALDSVVDINTIMEFLK